MSFSHTHTCLESSILSPVSSIYHGFSLSSNGDMRNAINVKNFLTTRGISDAIFLPKQVHGSTIIVNPEFSQKILEGDGVLLQKGKSSYTSTGVITADCVPVLFSDIHGTSIGAVHAGWKGLCGGIIQKMVTTMKSNGVAIEDIRIAIGPHIGACCYSVPEARIELFKANGIDVSRSFYQENGTTHLDLGTILMSQLQHIGIMRDHIDTGIFCTSCQKDSFFSFRRNTTTEFGEMIATVGFTY